MKKFYFFIMLSILAINLYAQAPEGFKYQAVLRNTSGEIIATTDAEVEIIILQGSENGTEVYAETHDITTNSYGLFTLNIGDGSTSDNLGDIDWANGPYFIEVNVDGSTMGTSQLLSVPYARYAEDAGNAFSGDYDDLANTPDLSDTVNYIKNEADPVFNSSVAQGITASDTASWNESKNKWSMKENDTLYYDKGLVGIGTDKPISDLTVEGTGKPYDVMIRDTNAFMVIDGQGSNSGMLLFNNGSYKTTMYYSPLNEKFQIYNQGSTGLTLNSSNFLGIKTLDPQEELHVNGAVRVDETTQTPNPKTLYGNAIPLAYASVNTNGTLLTGYGVSSVDNPETGYYTVNLENVWSGNPVVLVTCYNSTPNDEVATYFASQNDNKVYVRLSDGAGNPIISVFSILVYGMPE